MQPDHQQKSYKIYRECFQCGHVENMDTSKRDAAFGLFDFNKSFGNICMKCKSARFIDYFHHPELDYELLKEWANNSELF